tara:strand:+ start:465 stop:773 length:309 start_codon:yes stop_codon:yes gene_type:complete
MKKIVEYVDGFRWVDGNTSSAPFTKDSDQYKELIADGAELVEIPQAEKDAHEQAEARVGKMAELAALDVPVHTLARAIGGDPYAIKLVAESEVLKDAIRVGM